MTVHFEENSATPQIIEKLKWIPPHHLEPEYMECGELLAIFTSIGKN
jgi:hypothetical protein